MENNEEFATFSTCNWYLKFQPIKLGAKFAVWEAGIVQKLNSIDR